jgi:predicted metal-dependent RNase
VHDLKLSFFGAAEEVGRSCIFLESDHAKVLLDAGIKLGKQIEYPNIPPSIVKDLDAVILSHTHLDHSGYLPHLFAMGYTGKVYATKPTIELTNVMLSDYISISAPKDVTNKTMDLLHKSYEIAEFREPFKIKDLDVEFFQSGHILGSSMVRISDGRKSLFYTGDLQLAKTRLLGGADLKNVSAETLLMECTYGSKKDVFPPESVTVKKMLNSINETIKIGGKVMIPSFAVGNAEQVLLMLDDYMNSGVIQKVPIYVDGMINKAMRIHRHNVIYARKELQMRILMSDYDPFRSPNFMPIENKGARGDVVKKEEGCIIVTTSGMIVGGPILFYLSKLAGNPRNKLLQIGYQAAGTTGRELQDGAREITIDRRKVKVGLTIENYHLSAHGDRPQLDLLLKRIRGLKRVFLIHGEAEKLAEFKGDISNRFDVVIPRQGERYDV